MKKSYFFGLVISVAFTIATVASKSAITLTLGILLAMSLGEAVVA
jgi:hypothetical protein